MTEQEQKRLAVFDAAYEVFSTYGFRRTAMNDIAEAAGMSRPALYLLFRNKEHLFRELAAHVQGRAIDDAVAILDAEGPLAERFTRAVLAYEATLYEPISASAHGEEIMDINKSIAGDAMKREQTRFVGLLADAVATAAARGEAAIEPIGISPQSFAELFMTAVHGIKKSNPTNETFRRNVREIAAVFFASIAPPQPNRAPR